MAGDDRERAWENRADRAYTSVTYHPWRWVVGVILACFALGIVGCAVGFIGDWGSEAKRIVSPYNVKEQNRSIIRDWNDMKAAAANGCLAKKSASTEDSPTLLENVEVSYAATYRRAQVDFDSRMADIYEAQTVRKFPVPSNLRSYPEVAPTYEEMKRDVC